MVKVSWFKFEVEKILSQDYSVEFLGVNFDKIISSLSEEKINKLFSWLRGVVSFEIKPIVIGSKKIYKSWNSNQLLVFRYPLVVGTIHYRVLLVKVKNEFYLEFHLGDHKYYDRARKELFMKK